MKTAEDFADDITVKARLSTGHAIVEDVIRQAMQQARDEALEEADLAVRNAWVVGERNPLGEVLGPIRALKTKKV